MNLLNTGPGKAYPETELVRFALYREQRTALAPRQCDRGEVCWVAAGPPAITRNGKCAGCGGIPRMPGGRAR
jgi:hypothetical protein